MKIFYTADLHLGHENVIKFCNRPFANAGEMNEALIKNWNEVVTDEDTVYILGDLAFRFAGSPKPILKKLKGKKHLIVGNHDVSWMKNVKLQEYFESVSPLLEIDDGDTHVTLCHYPMLSWNRMKYGAIHIHGHIHNNIDADGAFAILKNKDAYNAGVDVNGFKPVTLDELKINKDKFYSKNNLYIDAP